MTELLLRPMDVARVLQVSRSAVYELAATGRLPVVRLGRSVRIHREALERLLRDEAAAAAKGARAAD